MNCVQAFEEAKTQVIMRFILAIKILLAVSCICLCIRICFTNYSINKLIGEQSTALVKLKNDPHKDSSENRKLYGQRKLAIYNQIDRLQEKKDPRWYMPIAVILSSIAGFLIRNIVSTISKKSTA